MARCPGLTRNGDQCTHTVAPGSAYCYGHDPSRAEERSRNASKAGKSRHEPTELAGIKAELKDVISGVHTGEVDKGKGAVLAQLYNVLLRGVEIERRIEEQEVLLERLEALEEAYDRGDRSW